jgi:hypothetical protein
MSAEMDKLKGDIAVNIRKVAIVCGANGPTRMMMFGAVQLNGCPVVMDRTVIHRGGILDLREGSVFIDGKEHEMRGNKLFVDGIEQKKKECIDEPPPSAVRARPNSRLKELTVATALVAAFFLLEAIVKRRASRV